jgi:hypothetical protein
VLHFKVRQSDLDDLRGITFNAGDETLNTFLRTNRAKKPIAHDLEMIEGPMLRNVGDFMAGKPPRLNGNQIAFFGDRAARMLDEGLQ